MSLQFRNGVVKRSVFIFEVEVIVGTRSRSREVNDGVLRHEVGLVPRVLDATRGQVRLLQPVGHRLHRGVHHQQFVNLPYLIIHL